MRGTVAHEVYSMPFEKFPSLESFGHVWRYHATLIGGKIVTYRAKIKLHGTNAAIRVEDGTVTGQKRTSDVFVGADNAGFAAWLEPRKEFWNLDPEDVPHTVTYFGEWAGPGVQSGDAVAQLDKKYFFIFAVKIDDEMFVEPEQIESYLPHDAGAALDDVIVLPWADLPAIEIDFSNPTTADARAEFMSEAAEKAGEVDPFIKDMFGVEGHGEGYVWVPTDESCLTRAAQPPQNGLWIAATNRWV